MYKLTPKSISHISFQVPRRTGATEFQEDLFPPTFASTPAIDADAFFAGKNAEPNTTDMAGLFTGKALETKASDNVVADSGACKTPSKPAAASAQASPAKGPAGPVVPWRRGLGRQGEADRAADEGAAGRREGARGVPRGREAAPC